MDGLSSTKVFGGLLQAELQRLDETSELRAYSAGQDIIKEGDAGDGIYVIAEGAVRISCPVGQDQRLVLSQLEAGEFFGEMAVLDEQRRSATATAETDAKIYFIPRDALLRVLAQSPELALTMMKEFSLRLREFNQQYMHEVLQAERLGLVGKFARSIVHDFKNPLNIIGISADMAAMDSTPPEARVKARDRIRRQVERMSNMIGELLEFTRGGSQNVMLARSDYGAFVRHLIDEIRPEVELKSVTLEYEGGPPEVMVMMEPRRLTHVFQNIINNACDAMAQGGKIALRFRVEDGTVLTEIQDSGPGIPREIETRIFEAFTTFGKASGTGLGLSICKRIVEDHRGTIRARNAPGAGAILAFTLPLAPNP